LGKRRGENGDWKAKMAWGELQRNRLPKIKAVLPRTSPKKGGYLSFGGPVPSLAALSPRGAHPRTAKIEKKIEVELTGKP